MQIDTHNSMLTILSAYKYFGVCVCGAIDARSLAQSDGHDYNKQHK